MVYTNGVNHLTLKELASLIKSTIDYTLSEEYWVTAEIASINCHSKSGHCYIDLVEKKEDTVTAKMRANIWARKYSQISKSFRSLTGQDLQTGMKILMLSTVTYHEVYGLSLNITDIDPRYTLGEMALKRKEVIEKLTKEGIIDMNRRLPLPPVLQKIAVISSETAAGYGDFIHRLDKNPYSYTFSHRLFQAYVQGERAEKSILTALKKCKRFKKDFDAVVIIRGGGSAVDLHCFDSYPLAKEIALFPLPVFTGIGHERDETVVDRVANRRLITPTAVAEHLISIAKQFEDNIDDLNHRLITRTNTLLDAQKHHLRKLTENLSSYSMHYLETLSHALKSNIYRLQSRALEVLKTPLVNLKAYEGRLKGSVEGLMKYNHQKLKEAIQVLRVHPRHMLSMKRRMLENYETKIHLLDPRNILERGYSVTYLNGKALKDVRSVNKDDIIETTLHKGTIISAVESAKEVKNE